MLIFLLIWALAKRAHRLDEERKPKFEIGKTTLVQDGGLGLAHCIQVRNVGMETIRAVRANLEVIEGEAASAPVRLRFNRIRDDNTNLNPGETEFIQVVFHPERSMGSESKRYWFRFASHNHEAGGYFDVEDFVKGRTVVLSVYGENVAKATVRMRVTTKPPTSDPANSFGWWDLDLEPIDDGKEAAEKA